MSTIIVSADETINTPLHESVACFAAGTLILTDQGEFPVEHLAVGDLVPTEGGGLEPIIWVGSRHVDCRRHPRALQVLPVCIRAHAFGPNEPRRDLFLSRDHAIFAEGVLIAVKHLINGDSIRQIDTPSVTYVHIELPRHGVILAEGLAAETYLDTGDRAGFAGAGPAIALHPAFGSERCDVSVAAKAKGYAPPRVSGREVARLRARLAERAASANAKQARAVVPQPGRRGPPPGT